MPDTCDLCSRSRDGSKTAGAFLVCDSCYRWVSESEDAILQQEEEE